MYRRVIHFLCLFAAAVSSQRLSAASSLDWEATCRKVIDRMEYRQSIANPINVTLSLRRETQAVPGMNRKAGVNVYTTTIARKGNLSRIARNGRRLNTSRVYDGSKVVIDKGHVSVVNGEKRRELFVSLDPSRVKLYPSPFDASGENHWLATMKDCLSRPDDVEGECKIDGGTLEMRLSVRLPEGDTWTNRAWLDMDHDYIPKRIEFDTTSDGANEFVRTIDETKDFPGLRLPSLARVVSRAPKKGLLLYEEVYELESCSLNLKDVPDSLFEVDLSGDIILQDLDHGSVLSNRAEVDEYLARISKGFWTTKTFWVAVVNVMLVGFVTWRLYVGRG